jgi:hypothetical protein
MKHVSTLEGFLNEGSFHVALFKARNEGLKEFEFNGKIYPVKEKKVDESEETLKEGVVSIKGGRILAHKVLNKLVDMEIIPVKKKTEDLVEAIASLLASASLNEKTLEEISEAMVQIAGKSKPSGAQVLATVIVDHMMDNQYLKPGADKVKKELVSDLQKLIMDSTF